MRIKFSRFSKIVVFILISVIFISVVVLAIDSWEQGYKLDQETIIIHYGDAGGTTSPPANCWQLTNTNANDYFVPTKTSGEMSSFISHKPAGVTSASARVDGHWTDWTPAICPGNCGFGDGKTGSKCGTWTASGTQTRTCTNPSPSCGGSSCSGSSSQPCTLPCSANCISPTYWCNPATGTCALCACSGQSLVLCGTTYAGPCGLTCSGTKCPSADNVPCGTTYTSCGCSVSGQQCSSGSCTYCSNPGGCACVGSLCEYNPGQYYCD
ncbi:MAG: hypothetical protein PHH00_03115 [Candidatus Nanoarchaeia archaeon]|nr:hypothetical protein [Candidatus Nanoarchaeia archaeon]